MPNTNNNPQSKEDDVGMKLMGLILMLIEDQTGEKYELIGCEDETA